MRADLREEFDMADEAFALSPISARATLPGEEDYAAISEAFMETARGRWFLREYAKRNRNADTGMVLDAVAGLEQKLAPVRKGARVIREIAWRLREIGNDGRICDLIDSQVSVIEAGAQEISADEARVALSAAFAAIEGRLAEVSDQDTTPTVDEAEAASPAPAPQEAAVAEAE